MRTVRHALLGPVVPGTVIGRWTVITEAPRRYFPGSKAMRYLLCRCSCGTEREVFIGTLRIGLCVSCGCHRRTARITHGMYQSSEYRNWKAMIQRCHNPKNSEYRNYGARGIVVCERWRASFQDYWHDIQTSIGPRPTPKHTLDRIRNNEPYQADNARWATRSEQMRNTRLTREEMAHRFRLNTTRHRHSDQAQ
jgi:hypothetical protein